MTLAFLEMLTTPFPFNYFTHQAQTVYNYKNYIQIYMQFPSLSATELIKCKQYIATKSYSQMNPQLAAPNIEDLVPERKAVAQLSFHFHSHIIENTLFLYVN